MYGKLKRLLLGAAVSPRAVLPATRQSLIHADKQAGNTKDSTSAEILSSQTPTFPRWATWGANSQRRSFSHAGSLDRRLRLHGAHDTTSVLCVYWVQSVLQLMLRVARCSQPVCAYRLDLACPSQHGGGYSYRLCKADQELTEECFQKTPLAFDKTKQALVWNTKEVPVNAGVKAPTAPPNSTLRLPVPNPVFVSDGTWPKGSMWARDPIPRIQDGRTGLHPHTAEQGGRCPDGSARAHNASGCLAFPAPCSFDTGMLPCPAGEPCDGNGMGACSSDWVVGLISDEVIIPKDLEPGHWVLSWRWGESPVQSLHA